MKRGPASTEMTAASTAAARARVTSRSVRQALGDACRDGLEADRARRLHEHAVARPHDAGDAGDTTAARRRPPSAPRPPRRRPPGSRGPARRRRPARRSRSAAAVSPTRAVQLGGGRAQLGHLAEHRDQPAVAVALGEARQRRLHRRGVGVVGVVDDHAAARQRVVLRRATRCSWIWPRGAARRRRASRPSARQTAIAAARLKALWRPVRLRVDGDRRGRRRRADTVMPPRPHGCGRRCARRRRPPRRT